MANPPAIPNKQCSTCKELKSLDLFYKDKSKKDGFTGQCRSCKKQIVKEYQILNKEKLKIWHRENYIKNKESMDKKNRENYRLNKEHYNEISKQWYYSNKESNRIYKRKYKKERRQKDILFKLKENLGSRVRIALRSKNLNKNNKFKQYIGCSINELKQHLEKQFSSNMSWDNYGSYWQIDHIIPLGTAKNEQEIYKLSNYLNLQPLSIKDHKIKTKKDIKNIWQIHQASL